MQRGRGRDADGDAVAGVAPKGANQGGRPPGGPFLLPRPASAHDLRTPKAAPRGGLVRCCLNSTWS